MHTEDGASGSRSPQWINERIAEAAGQWAPENASLASSEITRRMHEIGGVNQAAIDEAVGALSRLRPHDHESVLIAMDVFFLALRAHSATPKGAGGAPHSDQTADVEREIGERLCRYFPLLSDADRRLARFIYEVTDEIEALNYVIDPKGYWSSIDEACAAGSHESSTRQAARRSTDDG